MRNINKGLKTKSFLMVAALAVVMTAFVVGPANAAVRRGDDWHNHAAHNHAWYVSHPHYVPGYVVAPPPVVYAPPPSPGINLVVPLNFR